MKEKILDHEIEEILRDNPSKLTPLSAIESKLEINRKKKSKASVSKTTVYTKLENMVDHKKIHHAYRKGYKLLKYDLYLNNLIKKPVSKKAPPKKPKVKRSTVRRPIAKDPVDKKKPTIKNLTPLIRIYTKEA